MRVQQGRLYSLVPTFVLNNPKIIIALNEMLTSSLIIQRVELWLDVRLSPVMLQVRSPRRRSTQTLLQVKKYDLRSLKQYLF